MTSEIPSNDYLSELIKETTRRVSEISRLMEKGGVQAENQKLISEVARALLQVREKKNISSEKIVESLGITPMIFTLIEQGLFLLEEYDILIHHWITILGKEAEEIVKNKRISF